MGRIRLRPKNICILLVIFFCVFLVYRVIVSFPYRQILELIQGEDPDAPCTKKLKWVDQKKWPVIGLVGPSGSGVIWCRYLIEQLTGLYTGSTEDGHKDVFRADGKIKKTVVVMSHDIDELPQAVAAIVVYRSMTDTVRSQFSKHQGPGAFLEAPLDSFYGRAWEQFAWAEGTAWAQQYQLYMDANIPILVMHYEALLDPGQIRGRLLQISHFLHVVVGQNALNCLAERVMEYPHLKPRPLRYGFHPFELLPPELLRHLEQLENVTETRINKIHDDFLPRVHV